MGFGQDDSEFICKNNKRREKTENPDVIYRQPQMKQAFKMDPGRLHVKFMLVLELGTHEGLDGNLLHYLQSETAILGNSDKYGR